MNFQAAFPSSDKHQRMLTLSKHLQFPKPLAIQQARQRGKSFCRGQIPAISKALKNSDLYRAPPLQSCFQEAPAWTWKACRGRCKESIISNRSAKAYRQHCT